MAIEKVRATREVLPCALEIIGSAREPDNNVSTFHPSIGAFGSIKNVLQLTKDITFSAFDMECALPQPVGVRFLL